VRIPLVDLRRQHAQVARAIAEGFEEVFSQTSFIQGRAVADFEDGFARFCGVEHCIGVGSGTDALEMAVRALGLGRGDEVIVPANTFIASALAVIRAGAEVVLVDCDPDTQLIDVDRALAAVSHRTRAIMPVHLFGQMARVDVLAGALGGDIYLIEDGAQSQGATRNGRGPCAWAPIAGTSFYPGKNLGAYGDAGAVLTNDDRLAKHVRELGNWGSGEKYFHPTVGFNSRLDTLQAVVLKAKLDRLELWNKQRQQAADVYNQLLAEMDMVVRPAVAPGNEHVWHLYVVRIPARDDVLARLHSVGVGAGVHYPTPIHLQGALAGLGYQAGDFPVTEQAAAEILSLPLFPGITESEQVFVVEALKEALAGTQHGT